MKTPEVAFTRLRLDCWAQEAVSTAGPERTEAPPRCVMHGEMRYRAAGHWWVCPGWDGEGCCAIEAERVTGEAAAYEPWPGSQPSRHGFRPARVAT